MFERNKLEDKISMLFDKNNPDGFRIKITEEAVDKAKYVARKTSELAKKPVEVAFFILDDPENQGEPVIRDIYVAHEQQVTGDRCTIKEKRRSLRDIANNTKMKTIGWSHSHGMFSSDFISDYDAQVIENMLMSKYCYSKDVDGEKILWAPSIVVNSHDDHIGAFVGVEYKDNRGNIKRDVPCKEVQLETVDEHHPNFKFDKEKVDFELSERVSILQQGSWTRLREIKDEKSKDYEKLSERLDEISKAYHIIGKSLTYLWKSFRKYKTDRHSEKSDSVGFRDLDRIERHLECYQTIMNDLEIITASKKIEPLPASEALDKLSQHAKRVASIYSLHDKDSSEIGLRVRSMAKDFYSDAKEGVKYISGIKSGFKADKHCLPRKERHLQDKLLSDFGKLQGVLTAYVRRYSNERPY